MRSLAVTQDAFENQRKVVEEEYRMRVDESAYTKGYFHLMELLYDNYKAYAHPAIGSMKELDDAKLEWVQRFHTSYYMPNNAVLVVAGDFDVAAAKDMVAKYFGDIARGTVPGNNAIEPTGTIGPARAEVVQDSLARAPLTYVGFRVPRDGTSEHRALELAASILAEGDSSRLRAKLVRETAVAQNVEAYLEGHRGPDVFVIEMHHASQATQTPEATEEQVWTLLQAFANDGPTDAEMDTARAKIEHSFVFGLQGNLQRALTLANYEGAFGDATLAATDLDRYFAISKDDVKAVVAKYLVRAACRVVRVVPAPKPSVAPSASASASTKGASK
jgi:predicted Zn-dependent peptidase